MNMAIYSGLKNRNTRVMNIISDMVVQSNSN
jgi:hypothetical protein